MTERTNEMCTPSPRCAPEHSRQSSEPKVTLAHCGALVLQSAHTALPGSANTASRSRCAIWTALVESGRADPPPPPLALPPPPPPPPPWNAFSL